MLFPIAILFCSFNTELKPAEKKVDELTATNPTEQRLSDRVKIIKEFVGKNPKYNK